MCVGTTAADWSPCLATAAPWPFFVIVAGAGRSDFKAGGAGDPEIVGEGRCRHEAGGSTLDCGDGRGNRVSPSWPLVGGVLTDATLTHKGLFHLTL